MDTGRIGTLLYRNGVATGPHILSRHFSQASGWTILQSLHWHKVHVNAKINDNGTHRKLVFFQVEAVKIIAYFKGEGTHDQTDKSKSISHCYSHAGTKIRARGNK